MGKNVKDSSWNWFKQRHVKHNIHQGDGLDINRTQGLTIQSCPHPATTFTTT
jgi:hypothetical protein